MTLNDDTFFFRAEDRDRELDDILSDMLLTVQDIPDIGCNTTSNKLTTTTTKKPHYLYINLAQNQQPQQHHHQYPSSYNTDTVKRSHASSSYTTSSRGGGGGDGDNHSINTTTSTKDKELFYDTASTTTTITPTPSESGRDTPLISNCNTLNNNNNNNHHHHQQQQYNQRTTMTSSSSSSLAARQGNRHNVVDLQNQSYAYPQQKRLDHFDTSEDDEDLSAIPYHAREDSRPFTYGNPAGIQLSSPTGSGGGNNGNTGMLKMQSGLSSPSLVRKTLQPTKHVTIRNDFEDMLLQRREKVLNDNNKYSIGDKTPSVMVTTIDQYTSDEHNKWNNVSDNNTNGYHQQQQQQQHRYEPLKRSNTMDGGFSRSYSTDGG